MEPLTLATIDPDTVALLNDAVGTRRGIIVQVGGESFELRMHPPLESSSGGVKLKVGGHECWLVAGDWRGFDTLDEMLGETEFTSLPSDIQRAVLETVFDEQLDSLGAATDVRWEIAEIVESVPDADCRLGFTLSGPEKVPWRGEFSCPRELLGMLSTLLSQVPVEDGAGPTDIPLVAGVEIATADLTLEELESIEAGDVVFVEPFGDPSDDVQLRFGSQVVVAGQRQADGVAVTRVSSMPEAGDEPTDVAVSVECGRVAIPASQLETLNAGDVIPFQPTPNESVKFRAGGMVFAEGQLVRVGELTGVRIALMTGAAL